MKWWQWLLIILVILIIAFVIWYFIEQKRAAKEGREPKKLGDTTKKIGTTAAAAGILGAGYGGVTDNNRGTDGHVERQSSTESSYYSEQVAKGAIDKTVTSFASTTNSEGKRVVAEGHFYGNKSSHIYMGPGTTIRSNAQPKNYVEFDSAEAAQKSGYAQSKLYQKVIKDREDRASSSEK